MESLAQKKARANFKKAIAYRTKTGCSLKEAFAHVSGKKLVSKKTVVKKRSSSPLKKKKVAGYVKTIRKGNATDVLYTKKGSKSSIQQKLFGTKNNKKVIEPTAYDLIKYRTKVGDKKFKALTPVQRVEAARKALHKDTKSHNVNIRVISGIFDTQIIEDLDSLKKQYFKLAKKYHPDAGGTTIQFQQLQSEYEQLLQKVLRGSNLNTEQKENEIVIDKAIRDIIDAIINIDGLDIEVVGKWLWVGGDTYPVRTTLKQSGLEFIKKAGVPYWVYKGSESKGRGKMSIEEIRAKYGSQKMEAPKNRKISGFTITATQRAKLKRALIKLTKGLDKRPV
jgi:hypothetical protein